MRVGFENKGIVPVSIYNKAKPMSESNDQMPPETFPIDIM